MSYSQDFTPSINNDSADFIPSQGDYKTLQPFRYWCQKVLPLVYDDSLSYYELLCKVVDYLNKTMEDVETLHGDVDDMYTAFGQLQNWTNDSIDDLRSDYQLLVNYVNAYFNNLDVQDEINNKLDAMALNGTLTALISPYVPNAVATWLSQHLTPTTPVVDDTLSISGAAADAKVTGDKITELKTALSFDAKYVGIEQLVVLKSSTPREPFALTKGDTFIVTTPDGSAFPSFRINCYDSGLSQVDFFTFTSETNNPRTITWASNTPCAYIGLLDDADKYIICFKSNYSNLDDKFTATKNLLEIGSWNGFDFNDQKRTFTLLQRAMNSDVVNITDLFIFNANHLISSDGSYGSMNGSYATEEFYKSPVAIKIKNSSTRDSPVTVTLFEYNLEKEKTGRHVIAYGQTSEISLNTNKYFRISCNGSPEDILEITCNVNGLIYNGLDSFDNKISSGLVPYSEGNLITNLYEGYIGKNGTPSTGNYYYTNKIPVKPGQALSFWSEESGAMTNMQCRFLCAYNSSGTAVTDKGTEYTTAYIVPDGITSVVVSFANSNINPMAIFGVNKPVYSNTKNDLYVADSIFTDTQNKAFLQRNRSNAQLKANMPYYLDEKSAVCYCKPQNLTTAKINIYFNGNESTTGSSACFVDFANGTFGFYKAFGIYNATSLVVDSSDIVGLTFNVYHDYCIEYKRHSTTGYTLKVTDMMTLDSDDISTTGAFNGWGIIGYDATDVTVNEFKRLTEAIKNPTVLILGDSYTEGVTIWSDRDKRWCYLLGEAVGSYAINGQGGARSNAIEEWIDNYLFDVFTPYYVIIEVGTNEQAVAYFTRNLTNIIAKIKATGAKPILCTVPVTSAKPDPSDYNNFVINSGLPYIDICRALTVNGDMTTQNTDYFLADLTHPSITGHQRIFEMAKLNVPELFRDVTI